MESQHNSWGNLTLSTKNIVMFVKSTFMENYYSPNVEYGCQELI